MKTPQHIIDYLVRIVLVLMRELNYHSLVDMGVLNSIQGFDYLEIERQGFDKVASHVGIWTECPRLGQSYLDRRPDIVRRNPFAM